MNTEHLRYLLTVADCHSINRASEQLQLKQQYLSALIKNLEHQFGTLLFERTSKGVTPTADGQYILDKARLVLQLTNDMQLDYLYPSHLVSKNISSDIYLYMVPSLMTGLVTQTLHTFHQHFPKVTLYSVERPYSEMRHLAENDETAICIAIIKEPFEAYQAALPPSLKALYLKNYELVAVSSAQNAFAKATPALTIEEFLQKDLIVYAPFGADNTLLHFALSDRGAANLKYITHNNALFFNILHSGDYYSLGNTDMNSNPDFYTIALKNAPKLSAVLLINENALSSFAIKSFVNMFLATVGQPLL